MKGSLKFTILLVLVVGVLISSFAAENVKKAQISDNTVASLLMGLNSDNAGLKSGCAYMLGELKITKAVIPLMRVLRNDESEEIRISAALALYKIGTEISIYAVKQAGRFDESERVSKLAKNFYNEYLRTQFGSNTKSQTDSLIADSK